MSVSISQTFVVVKENVLTYLDPILASVALAIRWEMDLVKVLVNMTELYSCVLL